MKQNLNYKDPSDHDPFYNEIFEDANFPSSRAGLIEHAQNKEAGEEVLQAVRAMPDQEYVTESDFKVNLGQIRKLPGNENLWASKPDTNEAE